MHDVQLHFGDLKSAWARYGPEGKGMLLNLMFEYYDREGPLPVDADELEDIADARTDAYKRLLPRLLKKHLQPVMTGDVQTGWKWKRCDTEIARFKHRCLVNAYNNLCKHVKASNGALQLPNFEEFSANPAHFIDPITKRFRNLVRATRVGTPQVPTVSDSENVGTRNIPTPGDHSPTLPLSHSPTLPPSHESTPVVPKGDDASPVLPDSSNSSNSANQPQLIPDKADSPGKKKQGGGQILKDVSSIYADYPRKEGRGYAFKAIEKALERSGFDVAAMQQRVRAYAAAVANWPASERAYVPHAATWFNQDRYDDDPVNWERRPLAPPPRPDFGRGRGETSVETAFPVPERASAAPYAATVPDGYPEAWAALMGPEHTMPGWSTLDAAFQAEIQEWLKKKKGGADV